MEPKVRDTYLKRLYGISLQEYENILSLQEGKCAICGSYEPLQGKYAGKNASFPIDHDHTTGEIRGLLCSRCNRGIGLFKEDVSVLKAALSYLERTVRFGKVPDQKKLSARSEASRNAWLTRKTKGVKSLPGKKA